MPKSRLSRPPAGDGARTASAPAASASVRRPRHALAPVALAVTLVLGACATDDPNRRTKIGAGAGAVAGLVIGNQIGGQKARLIGAAIGGLAGGAVGRYQDKQQAALEAALQKELEANQIDVERLEGDVLLVRLSDDASFAFDSAEVKPAFAPTLDKLAAETTTFDKTVLHVVGYTDSTGSETYNRELSRRRAAAVAGYLQNDGVVPERLQVEGRGESEPRVSNDTAADRSRNRRVEIYIKPIVEGQEDKALAAPAPV